MKLTVKDTNGKDQGDFEVGFELIEGGKGTQAVHDVVVAYRAAQRSGTACAKTVGEVAGSNAKPWRQKGTGRARAGNIRSPIWRGGGVVFGPRPRDFRKTVNRKTRQLALRKSLTERLNAGDVIVVDELKLAAVKTKGMVDVLSKLGVDSTVVIVVADIDENTMLSARNLPNVAIITGDTLNTYEVLRADKLVFTRAAFAQIEARLKG